MNFIDKGLFNLYDKIHCALVNCGAVKEAHLLEQAKQLNLDNDDDYDQLQILQEQTALYNDYDSFWDLVRNYIGRNKCNVLYIAEIPYETD